MHSKLGDFGGRHGQKTIDAASRRDDGRINLLLFFLGQKGSELIGCRRNEAKKERAGAEGSRLVLRMKLGSHVVGVIYASFSVSHSSQAIEVIVYH